MTHKQNQGLLVALNDCIASCHHCAFACLEEKEVTPLATCIRNDIDCAAICSSVAGFIARGSAHGKHLLQECIEICEACAVECEKHASHMDHCKECAAACRKCVEACKAAA